MQILKCAFKSKFILKGVLVLSMLVNSVLCSAQADVSRVQHATIQLFCAMGDMLVYNTQLNGEIRNVISDFGYDTVVYNNKSSKANAKFFLFRSREPDEFINRHINIIAIPGTEKMKDVEVDLRVGKVLFAGSTPAEFVEYANTKETKSTQPLVHSGFNDYTQTAFFTPDKDGTMGMDKMWDIAADKNEHLILTGHSLGGAVAVLLGSRLQCMGVSPKNLEVVTFGAPAVGNQAFVDEYGSKVKHTRYTMSGDPVHSMLQMLKAGYVQSGEEIKCKRNDNSHRFSHSMSEYLDYSIRNYLDVLQQENIPYHDYVEPAKQTTGFSIRSKAVKDRLYMAPAVVKLPDDLLNDEGYMSRLTELLGGHGFTELVKGTETDSDKQIKAAQAANCDRIYKIAVDGKIIKKNVYQISVNEEITDNYGNIVSTQTCGTTTDNISPIEAVFYGMSRCAASRQMFR